jgi:hypothetical protein
MLTWIREKFGTVIIVGIIGLIAFVFIASDLLNGRGRGSTRGLGAGAVAGKVNGDAISLADFNRELRRRTDFFRSMMGGQAISEDQLRAFRIKEMVFNELVRRKLLLQEADRQGLLASDEEIKEQILQMPAFQKDGKFDLNTYKQVLEANSYSAGSFERVMREDLSVQRWNDYFRDRVQVTDAELRKRFLVNEDKRGIRYVLLNNETGKKGVKIAPDEVSKFVANEAKLNVAKGQYDREKATRFKGKTFEQAREEIVRELIAGEKLDEVRKVNEGLADQVARVLTGEKSSDAKVNAILKPYDSTVKVSGLVSRTNPYLPGIGEAKDLMADLFAAKSPIDPAQGGKPKKYTVGTGVVVAVISESQKPNLAKFDKEKPQLARQVVTQKQRELFEEWVKKLQAKASIERNESVIADAAEES